MTTVEMERVARAWSDLASWLTIPRTESDYHRLVSLLDALIDEVGEDEHHPLASLMDLVGTLIERYEDEHVPQLV